MKSIQVLLNEDNWKGSAFVKDEHGKVLAEMTYSRASAQLIIIDHTEVDDSLRGQGVGRKMLDVIVEKARREGSKILPLCPYVKSVFKKDDSLSDVLR